MAAKNLAKPIVPWMGGKSKLSNLILPLFPKHDCYVELFCGGAALFFVNDSPARASILNDINGELVNLYRVVQHHLVEFLNQFRLAISSRQIFEWHKQTPPEILTDIQRAARFYYLQQHAFGGKSAGQTLGTGTTSKSFDISRIDERLSAAYERLGGTLVENLPWEKCLVKYDRDHTFFYADPPYWQVAGYGVDFPLKEYEALAAQMRSCKGKVMVSINDHPDMRKVFEGFSFKVLPIKYSISSKAEDRKKANELLFMNWS
jgi:DNA adenine methylase